jgi:peptidoglycan hydrolase-like protein with peptidoglycan-binding domain
MRRHILIVLALVLVASGATLSASAAATRPVPFPTRPVGLRAPVALPEQLDPTPAYVPQIACQPGTLPGVEKLRALVLRTYGVGGSGNTARKCNEGTSEHADGRAWDWMVSTSNTKQRAAAGDFLAWLTAFHGRNAKRLGVMYVIHNKMIWGAYREADGWRPSSGHTDHIHISFSWNGARGNTSFWTGKVQPVDYGPCARFAGQPGVLRASVNLTPCARPPALVKRHAYAIAMYGKSSSTVSTAQGVLGISRTGRFDLTTRTAVRAYQKAHDLPVTGALDVPTWASLVRGRVTSDVTAAYTSAGAATYGLEHYSDLTLRTNASGKPVIFLQKALRMSAADRNGFVGAVTTTAVKRLQASAGLEQTGVAREAEWRALAAR